MKFEIEDTIGASPEEIYAAWTDAEGHAAMTGSPSTGSYEVGGTATAWGGYITSVTEVLEENKRIVQRWRTAQFTEDEGDSRVEITLSPVEGGTLVHIVHSDLPEHGMQYHQGWVDHYFEPMKAHFGAE